jgi:hypothetical protein
VFGLLTVRCRARSDVCFYECALRPEDLAGLPEELSAPGCRTAVAMSVLHPLCPARRSIVRARLVIAVTMFAPTAAGDTLITSIQQCVRPLGCFYFC